MPTFRRWMLVLFVVAGFVAPGAAVFAGDTETMKVPTLNIPIPGVDFTQYPVVKDPQGNLYIRLIEGYIGPLYNYAMGIVVLASAIMIVYGGFKYILSSSLSGVRDGREKIRDAIIGLILALGAYTILAVVNPSAVSLTAVKVLAIQPSAFDMTSKTLQRTVVETGAGPDVAPPAPSYQVPPSTPPSPETPAPITGEAPPPGFSECPVTLTNPLTLATSGSSKGKSYLPTTKDPRTQEFFQKIVPHITGGTLIERLSKAGDAAVKCEVHLGTCGNTAAYIWAIAGAIDRACLTKGCVVTTFGKGKNAKGISLPVQLAVKIRDLRCTNELKTKNPVFGCEENPSCIDNNRQATDQVKEMIKQAIPDYPQSWLKELRAGDYIHVYNGNVSCGGQHAAIFLGWASDGKAQVVQGPGIGKNPKFATICLKPSCGNWVPITSYVRPIGQ